MWFDSLGDNRLTSFIEQFSVEHHKTKTKLSQAIGSLSKGVFEQLKEVDISHFWAVDAL